ncbi:MAG: VanZ family protein [Lachnospiraceae bacterium]|nr:VanZ family protein [Lachnospiraceae bacterium]
MRLSDMISIAMDYLVVAAAVALVIPLLYMVGYRMIYQGLCKGKKPLSWKNVVWAMLFLCYIVVLCGATLMGRTNLFQEREIRGFFTSYREAWTYFQTNSWRNLFINILLFIPMGFLLPLGIRKLRVAWKTCLTGFGISLAIELVQLFACIGVFECDDLLNNTLGTLIGYGVFVICGQICGKIRLTPL